jgi:hypothetical protein
MLDMFLPLIWIVNWTYNLFASRCRLLKTFKHINLETTLAQLACCMKIFKFYLQFCKIHVSISQPKIPITSCHPTVFSGVVYDALIVFQLFKNLPAFYGTSDFSVLKSARHRFLSWDGCRLPYTVTPLQYSHSELHVVLIVGCELLNYKATTLRYSENCT